MNDDQPPVPRYRYLAPNGVTAANISCGFISMVMAADGKYDLAVYLLVVAIVLDTLDGNIARWLHATSEFGQEMDSFSDALSFGAAPAFLVYHAILRDMAPFGLTVALVYLLCAVLRLTRFNISSDAHAKERRTIGAPVPVAASYLMVAVLIRDQVRPAHVILLVLMVAGLMVSRIQMPNLKGRNLVTVMLLVGIVNYLVVIFNPCWNTIIWWNVWNALILVAAWIQDRRLEDQSA
ncbi:MAG: CDP-diacylglycerol--serine O-phosphatidyltransferase [Thermoanaerobaculales bacterium]|nr:CDP-diacylglycerol--serine O-phosphatidyltransferase [Thermoanaerobaculales bacterium]